MHTEGLSLRLDNLLGDLLCIGPELLIASGVVVLLLLDLAGKGKLRLALMIASVALAAGALWLTLPLWKEPGAAQLIFSGQLIYDKHALFSKGIVLLALMFSLLFSSGLQLRPEYYYLLFSLALGGMLMVGSLTLLSVYLSIEFTSLSGYMLTVFGFKKHSYEAGIKYLLFGAFASGLMLYGMSLLYGATGSLAFSSAGFESAMLAADPTVVLFASALLLFGLAFKVALVPMHLWAPDVYQTAPVPVAAIFSVVPKLGGLVVLLRLGPVLGQVAGYSNILLVLAAISISFGNLAALNQQNVRRMMAYSSIAQAGFLVLPVVLGDGFAITSFYFYVFIYLFMNYLAFYLIDHMEREQRFSFGDYKGMGQQNAVAGVFFLVAMVSLVGLPPLAGFTAKLYVFSALWNHWQTTSADLVLYVFLIAAANTVVALFYYLKIPYFMFLKVKQEKTPSIQALTAGQIIMSCLLVFMLVFFFVQPVSLVNVIQQITSQ